MMIAGLKLEGPLQKVCSTFGACNTPVAMLLVGYLLFPLLAALVLSCTSLNREMCLCMTMQIGCSVGATVG